MPQHEVVWVQEESENVQSWEFQYSPNTVIWRWVANVEPVDGCENCYKAIIEIPDQTAMVRARSIDSNNIVSEWSNAIYLNEPEFGIIPALLLLILLKRKYYGKNSQRLSR